MYIEKIDFLNACCFFNNNFKYIIKMDEIINLINNTQFNKNEIDELIKLLDKQKQQKVKNQIIEYIKSTYPKYTKYLEMIMDIEITHDVANYHQESNLIIYTNNLKISKSYVGTIDGEEQENIYTISSDSKIIFKFNSENNFYYSYDDIDDIDDDELISCITDTKKITKLAKLFKDKMLIFLKNIICLLDIINFDKKVEKMI